MPKKTKKQKIEAQRHRLQKKQEVIRPTSVQTEPKESTPLPAVQKKHPETKPVFLQEEQNTAYFRNDLLKSLMITMIIVCVQVALYVAQISGAIDITNLITF
ncbi:hypothetical protein IPM65_00180 [Candidatus Roizmanbacteria bacterium]|nr:MAG: hypothetical protein IPM65_00180 [Candidatus Roizmanbacteria bacterium]